MFWEIGTRTRTTYVRTGDDETLYSPEQGASRNANKRVLCRRREHAQNEGSGSPSVDRTNEPKMLLFLLHAAPQTNVKTVLFFFFILIDLSTPHTHERKGGVALLH